MLRTSQDHSRHASDRSFAMRNYKAYLEFIQRAGSRQPSVSHRRRRRNRTFALVTSLVLALGACAGDGAIAGSTEPPPLPPLPPLTPPVGQPGRPLSVQPTTSAKQRVTRVVTPEAGGTLSTTGPDGTRYTLVIPPKAVYDSIEIAMTPLSAVGGLPLSGDLTGGVQLEPDGLRLAQMATLTIEPVNAVDRSSLNGFGYYGNGEDFHLYPTRVTQGGVAIQLFHFSGWGIGKGTAADRATQLARTPGHWEAAVVQAIIDRDVTGIQIALTQVYLQTVMPLIGKADQTGDLADMRAALTAVIALERISQLALGNDAPKFVDSVALMTRWMAKYFHALRERCRNANDLNTAAQMVALLRQAQVIGIQSAFSMDDVYGCLRFELDFDSRIVDDGVADVVHQTTTSVVKADDLPIMSIGAPNVNVLSGSGPIRNVSMVTQTNAPCRIDYSQFRDGTFQVQNLAVNLQTRPDSLHPFGGDAIVKSVMLLFDPGDPKETITFHCANVPSSTGGETDRWRALFMRLHENEYHRGAGVLILQLNPGTGAVIGSKGYNRTVDCSASGAKVSCKEETVLTVYHRPK